jgi:Spy/CpxP family protein refolding chaperone
MRSKTSAALVLIAIFLLGSVAGGVSHYVYQTHFRTARPQRQRLMNRHEIVEEMAQELMLDAGQKEKLRVIFQQSREQYNTLSLQFRPQYEKIRSDTDEAIRAILRPDQKQKFEGTLKKMDTRHQDHVHEPPVPPSK